MSAKKTKCCVCLRRPEARRVTWCSGHLTEDQHNGACHVPVCDRCEPGHPCAAFPRILDGDTSRPLHADATMRTDTFRRNIDSQRATVRR